MLTRLLLLAAQPVDPFAPEPPPTGGGAGQLPTLQLPNVEYSAIAPMLILIGGALLILLGSALMRRRPVAGFWTLCTVLVSGAGFLSSFDLWNRFKDEGTQVAFSSTVGDTVVSAIAVDGFAIFFMVLVCATVALGSLLVDDYLRREGLNGVEYHVLILLSGAGGILMASANDLLVLFLGLEILSIAMYVLAGYHRRRIESGEAAMKYFVLGAFSSAFLLYGIALVYGATGSTNLHGIATYLTENVVTSNGLLLAGALLILVGLGFKVSAVPFHTWTPDVYQGSPSPAAGFMAAAAKAAGFAGLLRVFLTALSSLEVDWRPVVWVMAVLTLVVGSVLAIVQTDIKRMLAYSSISHAGFILVGLEAATDRGRSGSLFYVFSYAFMVLGSFGIVTLVGRRGDAAHDIDTYRGLGARRPGVALAFTVLLLAQAGAPFTTGLLAKFYVISAAVQARSYALALIAMLSSVVAAFFYLRVVVLMYANPAGQEQGDGGGEAPAPLGRVPISLGAALAVTILFTVIAGLVPSPVIDFARDARLLF